MILYIWIVSVVITLITLTIVKEWSESNIFACLFVSICPILNLLFILHICYQIWKYKGEFFSKRKEIKRLRKLKRKE